MFEDPDVDAVVIASSTDSHAELAVAAARAGKQIFLEKPVDMGLLTAKIRAMLRKA